MNMTQQGFDISKYITAADIAGAVAAGAVAYLTYKTKQEEPKPEQPQQGQQPQAAQPQAAQPRGQAPAAQPQAQPQAPAVPKKEPGWMKYCDDPSDPNEVAAARLQYKAEQLSNATGGAPSATGTFQGGQLTSATPTAAAAPSAGTITSIPKMGNGNFRVGDFGYDDFAYFKKNGFLNGVGLKLRGAGIDGGDWGICRDGASKLVDAAMDKSISPAQLGKVITALGPGGLKLANDMDSAQCTELVTKLAARLGG